MNPLLQAQISELADTLEKLRSAVAKQKNELDERTRNRDDLQQEVWTARKELTTLRRIETDYDSLQTQNEAYRAKHSEAYQTLQRILRTVKALSGEYPQ